MCKCGWGNDTVEKKKKAFNVTILEKYMDNTNIIYRTHSFL